MSQLRIKSKSSLVQYPKEISKNLDFRWRLYEECRDNPESAAYIREYCRQNIIFWIDVFCWTKDPRKNPDVLPWICYDEFQIEAIKQIERSIDTQEDLLQEKSRDMGASWMTLYVIQHKWLFEDGSDFRVGSRKEEFVDRPNDIDTLFEKLRFNLNKQPKFLRPDKWDARKHSTYMRLINPDNGNAIIGESANEDFGSGGRRKAVVLDEFSKWDNKIAKAAWTSCADVTKCRLPLSTPKGSGNKFALLAKGTTENIRKLTLHWTLHPEKNIGAYVVNKDGTHSEIDLSDNRMAFKVWERSRGALAPDPLKGGIVRSDWYDAESERRTAQEMAQELDIDYLTSGFPFFDLRAISKQIIYKYYYREDPGMPIPYNRYIQGILVETDLNKVAFREKPQGWLKVFELPDKRGQYALGGDVAEGLAKGDECFGVVRDKLTRDVVATFNGIFDPDEMAIRLQKVGRFFNMAITAPENNNHGFSVCSDLKKMDCNLYHTTKTSKNGEVSIVKAGWSTTATTRPQMLDKLEEEVRKQSFEMRDGTLIAQCETFVRNEKTGKPEADGDYLDDGVIALAISGAVIQQKPYVSKKEGKKLGIHPKLRPKNAKFKFGRRNK